MDSHFPRGRRLPCAPPGRANAPCRPNRAGTNRGHYLPQIYCRILDRPAAPGRFPSRNFLPRLLQTPASPVFHQFVHPAGRYGVRSLRRAGHYRHRSRLVRPQGDLQRRQSPRRNSYFSAFFCPGHEPLSRAAFRNSHSQNRPRRHRPLHVLPSRNGSGDRFPAGISARAQTKRRRGYSRRLDSHGSHQPPHRAFSRFLFGVHPSPQPGGFRRAAAQNQRQAESNAGIPGYSQADPQKNPPTALQSYRAANRSPETRRGKRPFPVRRRPPHPANSRRRRAAHRYLPAVSERGAVRRG